MVGRAAGPIRQHSILSPPRIRTPGGAEDFKGRKPTRFFPDLKLLARRRMRPILSAVFMCFLLAFSGCARLALRGEDALSLKLPDHELAAVQHTRDPAARERNVLYLPARAITAEEFRTPDLSRLVEAMRALMHRTGGIGIAANQVGKRLQLFMIEAKPNNPRYQVLGEVPYQLFINPRIIAASAERRNFWHGCLSAVGEKRGNVATYEWIEVEAADEAGIVRRARLEGLAAVIFQHELRHLLGGTYLD
ncbi:MAG: peptide deformylase, partial [Proteobacteria bacterium]